MAARKPGEMRWNAAELRKKLDQYTAWLQKERDSHVVYAATYSTRSNVDQATANAYGMALRMLAAMTLAEFGEENAPVTIAVGASCPQCGAPERTLTVATGVFGCATCPYTSMERDA